ncbi:MAG: EAL domain-containing protein [Actinomycetota bacterium]
MSSTGVPLLAGTWLLGLSGFVAMDWLVISDWGATVLWALLAPALMTMGIAVDAEEKAKATIVASRVRKAMRRRELVLHYQPEVNVGTGDVRLVEALVRWRHPRKGVIGPDDFVPQVERSRLVHRFNAYVLEEAVRQAAVWRRNGLTLRVAVNISPACLGPGLVLTVRRLLDQHALPAHLLELEITECGAQDLEADFERSVETLSRFHELGVKISLDDFGTGQSSLGRLVALPVDTLKIDRSFVIPMIEDELSAEVVRTAIFLAHTAGLRVVAEGVETERHMQLLRQLGADFAQGYGISRPMPAGDLVAWLDRRATGAAQLDDLARESQRAAEGRLPRPTRKSRVAQLRLVA